uniref:Potassium channel subfamily T member 2 n=1 Tax=Macrostomum lignano TaxID=282301 RepID=A0A1I8JEF5_9PLAT
VRVEFFTNERSLKERLQLYFIKNQRSSLRIRVFNFVIKILTCILYVIRAMNDNPKADGMSCYCQYRCTNHSTLLSEKKDPTKSYIHWSVIFFVNRSEALWIIQVTVAMFSLTETLLVTYLGYKGNIWHNILSPSFLLELINTSPFILTIFSSRLRCLFVPVFLNCWLAKKQLEQMFADLNRVFQRTSSALAQRLMTVTATTLCIIFTSVCGIQHLQRGGERHFTLFDSFWFVMVTFSTVGYGDLTPDVWPSQLFMILMICVAITVLPSQVEKLVVTWIERKAMGATYSRHRAQSEKHVVVCTTTLHSDTIMDFLNEFYAHPKLQDYYVILFSPCELDSTLKIIMQVPIWSQRVIYIQGSALKDSDLARCRMQDAEACFILCPRSYQDRSAADQHTIMRAWAVNDFAPQCPQYVQIYRPENKIHVKFAEYVVCEDEFKYAILANNCLCPGISTLVTLLLHTSRGQEGQTCPDEWVRIYGKCSGNEIYHVRLGESRFFGEYKDKSFTYASFHAHRKFGVALVAVRPNTPGASILLNPGPRHVMQAMDTCYYMSITKEENTTFVEAPLVPEKGLERVPSLRVPAQQARSRLTRFFSTKSPSPRRRREDPSAAPKAAGGVEEAVTAQRQALYECAGPNTLAVPSTSGCAGSRRGSVASLGGGSRRASIAAVPSFGQAAAHQTECGGDFDTCQDENMAETVKDFPPVLPYVGNAPCLSHVLMLKRSICCLNLSVHCNHCNHRCAKDYNWANRGIIVCADFASNGLYNFILPLRAHWLPRSTLKPIVLLLEKQPDRYFLEAISHFPLVYWMIGSIENVDDLLNAGILYSDSVVIVNKESSNSAEEDTLGDCNTIVAVQTIFKLFPSANIITELSQSSNMRFTQFKADDSFQMSMSKVEKKERERGSNLSYMFRLGFAAGTVFSASMLDTLLYQAFVKDYLIDFVRLLLGIDQARGSGHLASMEVKTADLWIRTYGRLYQKLCASSCDIPIGIYKTFVRSGASGAAAAGGAPVGVVIETDDEAELHRTAETAAAAEAMERREIAHMVRYRMGYLKMGYRDYDSSMLQKRPDTVSYVIINPPYDQKLELGDIVFLIRPSSLSPEASPLIGQRRGSTDSRASFASAVNAFNSAFGEPANAAATAVSPAEMSMVQSVPILVESNHDSRSRGDGSGGGGDAGGSGGGGDAGGSGGGGGGG